MSTDCSRRSEAARSKNPQPCNECKRNRQGCKDGYPCSNCRKYTRGGCTPSLPSSHGSFIFVDPGKHLQRSSKASHVSMSDNRSGSQRSGGHPSNSQPPSNSYAGSNGYPVYSSAQPMQRQTFGTTQLLKPNGESDGFIESFIHTHNGVEYYGARYYTPQGIFMKEDLFLSLVAPGAELSMRPPSPPTHDAYGRPLPSNQSTHTSASWHPSQHNSHKSSSTRK